MSGFENLSSRVHSDYMNNAVDFPETTVGFLHFLSVEQ
jgi:hypothetical protein